MKIPASQRFLALYSGLVTLAFGFTSLSGFVQQSKRSAFDQIDVRRINIVEPDGQIRMVLSNRSSFPGSYVKGVEFPRGDRRTAGTLFMNDEGTEMGGLIFGGSKDKEGNIESYGHLSFDQYMQDQIFSISAGEGSGHRFSTIRISDRGDYPITESLEFEQKIRTLSPDQRRAEWKKFFSAHPGNHERIEFGRSTDRSVILRMKDIEGHDRLVLQVTADGSPVIKFLDKDGRVTSQLPK